MARFLLQERQYEVVDASEDRKDSIALVVIVVFAALAVVALLVAFSYYWHIRNKVKRKYKPEKAAPSISEPTSPVFSITHTEAQVFTFKQLQIATGNFNSSNIIGNGGFGSVYKGVLHDGTKVAIKLLDQSSKQGEQEFRVEVDVLSTLHNPYLLRLIGYCADNDRRVLVYEFMPNGSLQEHLYCDGVRKLDWETRMRIALDAARGLEYLHEYVDPPVIHRDFKSSNILLDRNYHAKVSDFGLAKLGSEKAGGHVSTRVLGTQGYVAPEYALTGHLTTKSDVYSYGVVLLELLTGRVPVDMKRPPGQAVLVSWALPLLTDRDKLSQIVDPGLHNQYPLKELVQVAAIAAMCVQPEADYRPLMADVVQSLVPLVKQHRPSSRSRSRSNGTPKHHRSSGAAKSTMDSGGSSSATNAND